MKRAIFYRMKTFFAIIILAGMIFPSSAVFAEKEYHKPITRELINLLEKNPEIGRLLEASIAESKKVNPDPKTNPVQSLQDYYNFIDRAAELIPLDILESSPFLACDQMRQSLRYFYFLVGQPLPELEGKGLYKNALQYYPPFSQWLHKFAKVRGEFLNTPESWNEKIYQQISKDPSFGLQKGWYESPSNWKTFNQFFSRRLKSPEARPIASPDDPAVVVSPADAVPQGVWAIDENSNIRVERGLKVKTSVYYRIKDLLAEDSPYNDAFANGVLTHTYLNVNDYHRYHFAVGGKVLEKRILSENVAYETAWVPEQNGYTVIDSTGWQFSQTRGYVIVDTGKYGIVALIPIGMELVSSVNFEDNVRVVTAHKKGDMLGYFLFGGSDFIMIFQEEAGFKITAPTEDAAAKSLFSAGQGDEVREAVYKQLLVGEEYGVMKGQTE